MTTGNFSKEQLSRLADHVQETLNRILAFWSVEPRIGSFGNFLFQTYGINKMKQFHRLSHEKDRPWLDVFGIGMQELEANWLKILTASEKTTEENVSTVLKLIERNPGTACAEAQELVTRKR